MGRESHRETVKKKRAITQKWKASNNWAHRNKYNIEMGGTQNGQMNLREFLPKKKELNSSQKEIKTVKCRKEINNFVTILKKGQRIKKVLIQNLQKWRMKERENKPTGQQNM